MRAANRLFMGRDFLMKKHHIVVTLLEVIATLFFVVVTPGCKDDAPAASPGVDYGSITTIVYSQHVQPLLGSRCAGTGCHDGATMAAGLSLASWNDVMNGSQYGEAVVPHQPSHSLLVKLFDGSPVRKQHPASIRLTTGEAAFLERWIAEGAKKDDGSVLVTPPGKRLYVPNQGEDNVCIVDQDRMVVTAYMNVGNSPANDGPHFIVANQDYWYVSLIGAGEVWKFDAHSDSLVGTASVAGSPALLALTPDGSKLYVTQFMTSSTNRVVVLNTATMSSVKSIPVWTMPHGIRMNHAGTRVYVANMMSDNLSVIDVFTDSVVATVPLAFDAVPFRTKYMPMEVAISPDDSLVLVTCSEWDEVRMFSASSYALLDSFHVGDQPWHLQFTPDGEFCNVTNRLGNSISVIHIPMRHVMSTIVFPNLLSLPHGIDVSPNGRYMFVSNENVGHLYTPRYDTRFLGNVCVIDRITEQLVKVLEVGVMPTGLAVTR